MTTSRKTHSNIWLYRDAEPIVKHEFIMLNDENAEAKAERIYQILRDALKGNLHRSNPAIK